MRIAVRQAGRGDPTRLPHRIARHVVASRYGVLPEAVDEMPADDYFDAIAFLAVTR